MRFIFLFALKLHYLTDGVPSTPQPEEEKEEVLVVKDESISDVKSIMMDMMNEPSQMFHENSTIKEEEEDKSQAASNQSASGKSDEGSSSGTTSNSSTPEPPGPWNYDEKEDSRTYAKSGGCTSLNKMLFLSFIN